MSFNELPEYSENFANFLTITEKLKAPKYGAKFSHPLNQKWQPWEKCQLKIFSGIWFQENLNFRKIFELTNKNLIALYLTKNHQISPLIKFSKTIF